MKPIPMLIGVALLAAAAAVGWGFVSLRERHRQTVARLQETQATLEDKKKTLTLVEEERQKLAGDYEALKTRSAQTDDELKQLQAVSTQTKAELAAVSTERSDLRRRLKDAEGQQTTLQSQLTQLRRQKEEEERRRMAAEAQLNAAIAEGLTKEQVEQLSQTVEKERREASELHARLEALSRAFEQLVLKHIDLQEATGQSAKPGAAPIVEAPPGEVFAQKTPPSGRSGKPQRQHEAEQLAARYRHLGQWCMAAYQYPRAAQAFERSLTYQDSREIHATLAFLYSRLLPDEEKAAYHAALAPQGVSAQAAMDPTTQTHGLPRKDRSLLWHWLTD